MAIDISYLPSTILVHHYVPRFVHRVLPFFASQTSPVNALGSPQVRSAAMEPDRGRTD
jgi:hypothetical protein